MLNGHKLNPTFKKVNKILSAGPTHESNLAKILLQNHLKMEPPTSAFVQQLRESIATRKAVCFLGVVWVSAASGSLKIKKYKK